MTTWKQLTVVLAVIAGCLVLYVLVDKFDQKHDFLKVYKAYKEKGKSTQFNMNDVKKGFQ